MEAGAACRLWGVLLEYMGTTAKNSLLTRGTTGGATGSTFTYIIILEILGNKAEKQEKRRQISFVSI